MRVAVVYGDVAQGAGRDELDVLVEVKAVSDGLAELGHEALALPVSLDLEQAAQRLASLHPALAFNLVESLSGRGSFIHVVPALLDAMKIPYTGAGTEAIFLTSNKALAKRWLSAAGLPTPPWFTATERREGEKIAGPWLVKSAWEHASIGLDEDSVIPEADRYRLLAEMKDRRDRLGGACLAEAFIEGREFNLSLMERGEDAEGSPGGDNSRSSRGCGPEVLPPAEIRFDAYPPGKVRVVGYRSKWENGSFEFNHTPRSFAFPSGDGLLLATLKELALRCWRLFDLRGYARVDFRVDKQGRPWILEVNTNPCLSPDAGFRAAASQAGLNFTEILKRIIGRPLR